MGSLLLMQQIHIRRMQESDLPAALKLTQAESWSHRLEDWAFHYRLGRGWVACNERNAVVGTILYWSYGDELGSIGLVVVDRNQQGKGIGRQLMHVVLNDSGGRSLQLIATRAGLKLYQQCGFREIGMIEQRQGEPRPAASTPTPAGTELRAVEPTDFAALYELDARATGANRQAVLGATLETGTGVVAHRDGRILGFALIRSSGRGKVIGPVVAESEASAMTLIAHHLHTSSGFTRVDVPAGTTELSAWLDTVGLACVDRVTSMLRGNAPKRHGACTYGLVSQALG
jgi:predicted N-acetyltransferase YhbS